MMTERVLSFHRRATRLLASDERPALDALDTLITDGCAEALQLETELSRLGRRREPHVPEELDALRERLHDVRYAVSALMRRRSQQRLTEFLTQR